MSDYEIQNIKKFYNGICTALDEAEKEYIKNKRSVKKREEFYYIFAQETAISDLCAKLGIELHEENNG